MRYLFAELGGQIAELFGPFEQIAPLETEQQAHVKDLEYLHVVSAAPELFEFFEESVAGEKFAEQLELQWLAFPFTANRECRAKNDFVLVAQSAYQRRRSPRDRVRGAARPARSRRERP